MDESTLTGSGTKAPTKAEAAKLPGAGDDRNPHIRDNMPPLPIASVIEGPQGENESWADYLHRQNRAAIIPRSE